MEIKYHWKELSSDGLLKEPEDVGAYYESESFNEWGGYASEEDAVSRFRHLEKGSKWNGRGEFVLVKIYTS